jgi:hypothetical protein
MTVPVAIVSASQFRIPAPQIRRNMVRRKIAGPETFCCGDRLSG